jgi:hypothetical protein
MQRPSRNLVLDERRNESKSVSEVLATTIVLARGDKG